MNELSNDSDLMSQSPRCSSNETDGVDGEDPYILKKRNELSDLAFWFSHLGVNNELNLNDPFELCNGRAFAEMLNRIDEVYFDAQWLETIPELTSKTNRVVMRSNLRKIWRKVSDYITEKLNRRIASKRWTNIDERVDGLEETDLPVSVDFAMLIVTLAHIGPTKEEFVEFSTLRASENSAAMETVARLISIGIKELPLANAVDCVLSEPDNEEEEEVMNELNISTTSHRNGGSGRTSLSDTRLMDSLYSQVENLKIENARLLKEIGELGRQLEAVQLQSEGGKSSASDSSVLATLEKMNEDLKIKRREAEEKVHELEGQLESLRPTIKELTIENEELKSTQKGMSSMKSDLQAARDDLEIWREKAEKAAVESDAIKKKDRELKELHQQIKVLQSRLDHHVKQSTADEENKTSVMTLRQNIGALKGDLEKKDVELISKEQSITKLENDLISMKERCIFLEERKDQLESERNNLQEALLKASENVTERSLHDSFGDACNSNDDSLTTERIGVLEVENKRLMERIRDLEPLESLNGEIIALKNRNSQLEHDAQLAIKQKESMSAEIQELTKKLEENQRNMIKDMSDLKVQLERANLDKQVAEETAQKAETRLQDLEELLKRKTEENKDYEMLLNKSRTIINDLEERSQPIGDETGTSVQQFKQLRQEKENLEKQVAHLESVIKTKEEENRLLVSQAHRNVCDRNEERMLLETGRAEGGADVSLSPNSTILSQKSGSISWSYSTIGIIIAIVPFFLYVIGNIISVIDAPPNA